MSLKHLGNILKTTQSIITPCTSRLVPRLSRRCATFSNDLVHVRHGKQASSFNSTWLRENCQCPDCFTHATEQRSILFYGASSHVSAAKQKEGSLHIEWGDGHKSAYALSWLEQKSNPTKSPPKTLWNRDTIVKAGVEPVEYEEFMKTDDGVKKLLGNIWTYGIGLVSGAPTTDMELVKRVSFVQPTFFGEIWTFTADLARGDTAYTNIALGAHTDTTYLTSPAGIQVFHCTEHTGTGGETLLVDGFHAAEQLRAQDPSAFQLLTSTPVLHQYKEPGVHTESVHNILTIDPWEQSLQSIRYNHYDRAPLPPGGLQHLGLFYRALGQLSALIEAPESEYWLKLSPGTVLFVDNWRVMHGRAAFTGKRTVTGCYLPRDDWLSKARHLGVL